MVSKMFFLFLNGFLKGFVLRFFQNYSFERGFDRLLLLIVVVDFFNCVVV